MKPGDIVQLHLNFDEKCLTGYEVFNFKIGFKNKDKVYMSIIFSSPYPS